MLLNNISNKISLGGLSGMLLLPLVLRRQVCCLQTRQKSIGSQNTFSNYKYDVINELVYLGVILASKNDVILDIKRRIALGNKCL